jgi:KDO2-lipid IV(A) lauroyltransferase
MSRPHSLVAAYAVYLVVRLFVCVIQALSPSAARQFAAGLAWLAYRIDRRHREVARDNLRQAFPGKYSDAELEALVRSVYRHFCTLLIEIVHLPRKLHANNWKNYLTLHNGRAMVECLLSGRPL